MKLKDVRYLIHTDMSRYAQEVGSQLSTGKKISFFFLPCVFSLILYRFSYYFYHNNHYLMARFFYTINLMLFGIDIAPHSRLGSHLYIPHPVSIILAGNTGNFCTFFAHSGIGGGIEEVDIGAGVGLPILGNYVTVSAGAKVLGPVFIGDNSEIGALSLAMTDVPKNSVMVGVPGKVIKTKPDPSQ
jgi:serine O-acetyltransferase